MAKKKAAELSSGDRYSGFNFIVEIEGMPVASFSCVSGLSELANQLEHSATRDKSTDRKVGDRKEYDTIRLTNGRTSAADLYTWYSQAAQGRMQRKRGSLIVLDPNGLEKMRWCFVSAWPTKWEGPELDAGSTDITIDVLELTCDGLERA